MFSHSSSEWLLFLVYGVSLRPFSMYLESVYGISDLIPTPEGLDAEGKCENLLGTNLLPNRSLGQNFAAQPVCLLLPVND